MVDGNSWDESRSGGNGRGSRGADGYAGDASYTSGASGASSRDVIFDRVPPHDDDAEMAVLGGMLMSKDAIGEVSQMIDVTDFYQPKHQTIYEAIITLFSGSQPVDVVLVATPNDDHKELSIRAMRAGKHVLCEKPVMMTSKDLEDVLAVAKETGKVFYPRQNRRWDKDYLTMKKVFDEKLIGNVFHIESRYHGSRGIPGDWRGVKEKGGGMMFDWGVHLLDRIVLMVPEKIKKVYAKMTHVTNNEVDDGFIMNMVFESGITATVEVGTCNFITLPHWYLCGDQGTAEIKDFRDPGRMVILRSWEDKDATPILMGEGLSKTMAPRNPDSVDELPLPDLQYDRNQLYSNLCDVVLGKAQQIVTGEEALRVLRLMEAALESDEKGIVVDFE